MKRKAKLTETAYTAYVNELQASAKVLHARITVANAAIARTDSLRAELYALYDDASQEARDRRSVIRAELYS